MRFSIIIPFKRGTEYLRDCLQSLAEQVAYTYLDGTPTASDASVTDPDGRLRLYKTEPYRNFEVILVLDDPVDDVSGIIDEYRDQYALKVLDKIGGTGVSAARNAGIQAASGDYVYFLDSDDFLYTDALFRLEEASAYSEYPDLMYGKKIWSWYSRSGFIAVQTGLVENVLKEDEIRARKKVSRRRFFRSILANVFGLKTAKMKENGESLMDEEQEIAEAIETIREKRRLERSEEKDETREKEEKLRGKLSESEFIEFRRQNATRFLVYNRNGIGNISILHVAVKRSLIAENGITFPEDNRYYADCSFVCEVLYHSVSFRKCYLSKYVKRKHNDPINFPSIAQEKSDSRFDELIASYENAMKRIPADNTVRFMLDLKFIFYCTGFYATQIRRSGSDLWRTTRLEAVRRVLDMIPASTVKQVDLYKKRIIKAIRANDPDKVHRIVSRKLAVKKAWRCITSRGARRNAIYEHIFMKKPIEEKWVIFECFFGKTYGDNPKGIYEYIAKNMPEGYRLIWSMEKPGHSNIPYAHKTVKRNGLRYAYYLARCKYIVFNTKQPGWMKKRDGQVFVETWHGTPLKRLAFDMEDNFSASPGYKQQIYGLTRKWDYLVSANSFSTEKFRSCFMYKGKMLEYGYPRNDILHRPDRDEVAASIRAKLGIPADKKTILYAPTWRDDEYYGAGQYKFTLKLELPKLRAALGDEYVILLRTHYYIADKLDVTGMEGFAYNLSKYDDIADIYLISDICITDYSSVFFDYANLRRPMLFYTYDIDKYRDMLRGFYFDMEATVPGPLLYTTEEVIEAIKDIDAVSSRFADRYNEFYERFCGWEDGHASENIVRQVILGEKVQKRA